METIVEQLQSLSPEARTKICERVWFTIDEPLRVQLRRFHAEAASTHVIYADAATLNRMIGELMHALENQVMYALWVKVFWDDKMKEAADLHAEKINQAEV